MDRKTTDLCEYYFETASTMYAKEESNNVSIKTVYKQVSNKHRRKPDDPSYIGDLDELVDFSVNPHSDPRIINLSKKRRPHIQSRASQYQGLIFGLDSHPGFAFIPSALSPTLQRDLT